MDTNRDEIDNERPMDIEATYKRMTPIEHILARSEHYAGNLKRVDMVGHNYN